MRYDNTLAFEKHLTNAAPNHFSPLYFIIGKSASDTQEAVCLLERFLLTGVSREFAYSAYDAATLADGALEEALCSGSLFSSARVILIKQAEKMKKPQQEFILSSLRKAPPQQTLILSASGWTKNNPFYIAAEKIGVILELAELKPWEKERQLTEWVGRQATQAKKTISFQTSQLLVQKVGPSKTLLARELEKIICYIGHRTEIAKGDVERLCAYQHPADIWKLGDAIFASDAALAINIAKAMLEEGQPLLPLLRQIRSQFQTDYQVALMLAQGKSEEEIAALFSYMKGNILAKHKARALGFGIPRFKEGLIALDAAELRLKTTGVSEEIALELCITQLTSGGQ